MLKLLGKNIAVDPIMYDDKSPSGLLFIPDGSIPRANQGIVKYIGPDVVEVKLGDYVLFSGYTGTTVRLEDEGIVLIMHEDFVTCIIHPPGTLVLGLYFKDRSGEFFTATYEDAVSLLSRAVEDYAVVKDFPIKPEELNAH